MRGMYTCRGTAFSAPPVICEVLTYFIPNFVGRQLTDSSAKSGRLSASDTPAAAKRTGREAVKKVKNLLVV
jgi:hypothetical protein